MLVTIDNHPIFDYIVGYGIVIRDKKSAIDIIIARRNIRENNISLYWVDTGSILADCLTKLIASSDLILDLFRNKRY